MPQVNSATDRLEVMQREFAATDRYDDIINLPHHRSCTRPHMSMHNRAAQFMPFAALTGYDDIIKQTATHSNEAVERANTPVNLAEGYLSA